MGVRTSVGCYGEQATLTVTIDGKKMTYAEYYAMRNAKKKQEQSKKRKKETRTTVQMLPEYITKLIKNIKVLKSLGAYYKNGYRQWGTICRDNIINHPLISPSFVHYQILSYEMYTILADIEKIGKYNEKDIFQFIEKLAYKIDDIKTALQGLTCAVNESRVCEFYKDLECINGEGRRLGLSILMIRAMLAIGEIEKAYKELYGIVIDGLDPLEYNHISSKRIYKHGYTK